MKSLSTYIKEELETDIFWLLDKWFERNDSQRKEFMNIICQCMNDKIPLTKNIRQYLVGTSLKNDLKQFVNFIDNEVKPANEKDYEERLRVIIKQVIDHKSRNNQYIELYKTLF